MLISLGNVLKEYQRTTAKLIPKLTNLLDVVAANRLVSEFTFFYGLTYELRSKVTF